MVWVVAEFKDKSVAPPSLKWISECDGKTFCKWPLKDVEKKNRANTIPDNSKNWELHECRLLMKGERFDSYEAAREAVLICQEHSTMSNYIKSKSLKRTRKRPAKFSTSESENDNAPKMKSAKRAPKQPSRFATSDSESDNENERKEIESMRKSDDLKSIMNAKKMYSYTQKTSTPLQNTLNSISNNTNVDGEVSTKSREIIHSPNKGVKVQNIAFKKRSDGGSNGTDKNSSSSSGSDSSSDSDLSSDSDSSSDSSSSSDRNSKSSKLSTGNRSRFIEARRPFSPSLSAATTDKNENLRKSFKSTTSNRSCDIDTIRFSPQVTATVAGNIEGLPKDVSLRESSQSPTINRSRCINTRRSLSPPLYATVTDNNESLPEDIRHESSKSTAGNFNRHLFSPILSTINGDDDESGPTDIREELRELKKILSAITQVSKNNSTALQELKEISQCSIGIFKDLSAEVFKCKEEIKKRNGLFTDMLHPDIEVPLDETEQYDDLTSKLGDKRLMANLAKYLATIHNEHDEEEFVKASMQTLFTFNFLMKKVTWKKEPERVYFKKSRISKCWRDSFKLKFGAKESKSDKEIDNFIHGVCRRYKDASRKAKRTEYD